MPPEPPKIKTTATTATTPIRKPGIDKDIHRLDPMDKTIRAKWNELGGATGILGGPVPSPATLSATDNVGRYNRFEHGDIYWSGTTGAHEIHGDILTAWNREGSHQSLGYPTCDVTAFPGGGVAAYQNFENGRIEYVQNTARVISGAIYEKWKALGAEKGLLGETLAGESAFSDGKGRGQLFEHGWIYWRADLGAHAVMTGQISTEWQVRGGYSGSLGGPTADGVTFPAGDGWQDFEHGRIMWVQNGVRVVSGGIYDRWKALDAEKGSLGDAIIKEVILPDGAGRCQAFAHGQIYWRADLKAWVILNDAINIEWQALGGVSGKLGYPTSDQTAQPGGTGRQQSFEHGLIYWRSDIGAHAVIKNAISAEWWRLSGPMGTLGYPTTDEAPVQGGGATYQDFEHGRIFLSSAGKIRTVSGPIYDKWKSLGGEKGVLGDVITSTFAVHPDTPAIQQQKFKNGRITDFGYGRVSAALRDGGQGGGSTVPETPYMLTLEEVKCKGQTKGEPGADELWFRAIVQTNGGLNENGEVSKIVDYHNNDVNTGEHFTPALVLYAGRLPETLKLSYMAIQVNLDEDATNAMNVFTQKAEETGQQWFSTGNTLFEFIIGWNMASNTLGGAICVASGNPYAQWIGGVAGIAMDALLAWVLNWYKSKLIGANLSPYFGQDLLDESSGELPLPAGTGGTPVEVPIYGSSAQQKIIELVKVSYGMYDNGDIRESWEYSGTDDQVDYVFTFRHFLGDGQGPAPAMPADFSVEPTFQNLFNPNTNRSYFKCSENRLFWKTAGDALGWEVERSRNGEAFVKAATVRTAAEYADSLVQNSGEEFRYRIRAYNKNGYSPYSQVVTVSLPVPAAPYGLSASKTPLPGNVLQVHLYWMVSSTGDYGYMVERSLAGGAFVQLRAVDALVPSTRGANFVDNVPGQVPGMKTMYRLRGYNDYGDGPYSEVFTVTA